MSALQKRIIKLRSLMKLETYMGYTRDDKIIIGSLRQVMDTPNIEYGTIDIVD